VASETTYWHETRREGYKLVGDCTQSNVRCGMGVSLVYKADDRGVSLFGDGGGLGARSGAKDVEHASRPIPEESDLRLRI